MLTRFSLCLAALVTLCVAIPAQAATVSLVAGAPTVQQNDSFTVELSLAAGDVAGNHPGSFGGKVLVTVDSSLATFTNFVIASPAVLTFGPDLDTSGGMNAVELWFEKAEDIGVIGTFTFSAIGSSGSTIGISVVDADDFATSFFNADSTNTPFTPSFSNTSVDIVASPVVPVPAAVWLMMSALGLLGFRARRRS